MNAILFRVMIKNLRIIRMRIIQVKKIHISKNYVCDITNYHLRNIISVPES